MLGDPEAEAARLEVERRMLAADAADRPNSPGAVDARPQLGQRSGPSDWPAHAGRGPLLAARQPEPIRRTVRRAAPPSARSGAQDGQQKTLPSVEAVITQLEEQQARAPDDPEASLRLGQAYALDGQFERAIVTYRTAIARHPEFGTLHSALGEALVMASGGIVGEEARAAFERALERDPTEARARFYAGLAKLQGGEREAALDVWVDLIEDTPADAPWLPDLRQQAAALATDLGLDPARALPAGPAAANGTDARAAAARMEAQLAANPKDYQGWIRLAKAWAQLGDRARAGDALARGAQAYPGAPFVQQQLQAAAAELGIEPDDSATARGPTAEQMAAAETMSPEQRQDMVRSMVDGLAAKLEQQPDDIEGWRMLGRSWAVLGDPAKSAEAYAQVARRLPDDLASQVDYATALLAQQSLDQPPSPEVVAQLQQVLKLDGDNPIALFHLGRAAAANGDTGTATRHWQRLLAHLPADAPVRPQLERLIKNLQADG